MGRHRRGENEFARWRSLAWGRSHAGQADQRRIKRPRGDAAALTLTSAFPFPLSLRLQHSFPGDIHLYTASENGDIAALRTCTHAVQKSIDCPRWTLEKPQEILPGPGRSGTRDFGPGEG